MPLCSHGVTPSRARLACAVACGCNPMKIWSKGTPMERTADAIIIGAGVMGTSTAFQLIQRGVKRVVVLEKSTVAAGSSGKSSALVRMHYTFLPEARLALTSLRWFQEWKERVGGSCGFTTTGFVRLVSPDKSHLLRQ